MKTLIAGFVIVASMTLRAQLPDFNALTNKPLVSATSAPYGADPTGGNDSTTAIQNCINDTVPKGFVCALPAGTYKITGSGLTMPNQSNLLGLQNIGIGRPSLVYSGTGTAITIGNCSVPTPLVYGVNLVNVSINAVSRPKPTTPPAPPPTPYTPPQYGIQACGLSEANWDGLAVGDASTNGYFSGANIRFYEASEIDLLNLLVTNTPYQPGTTGILFDHVYVDPKAKIIGGGNATITIHGGLSALFGFQNAIVCKSCVNITFRDTLFEANDYGLFVDNSTWSSAYDGLDNVYFEGTEFLMDPQKGPTHNKVLQINSPGGGKLVANNLVFRNTKWQLQGGVQFPVELNIPSTGTFSVVSLKLDTNSIAGVNTAVVDSNNYLATIFFTGENDITDASGTTRPADFNPSGQGTVIDYAPLNTSQQPLFWTDPSGAVIMPGFISNTTPRPPANTRFPGLVFGTTLGNPFQSDFGFLRVGAGGSVNASNMSYCDFSGPNNSIPELNKTIDCFVSGIKVNRMDASGEHPMAVNILTEIGTNNAIVAQASASNPVPGFGLVVTVPLAHSLRAGQNTFAYQVPISNCLKTSPMQCTTTSAPANLSTIVISGLTGTGWSGVNGTHVALTNTPGGTSFSVQGVDATTFGQFTATNAAWANVLPIKSSFNPAIDISKGYVATGTIALFYNGSAWLDLKQ